VVKKIDAFCTVCAILLVKEKCEAFFIYKAEGFA